jgi:hypothetical protein
MLRRPPVFKIFSLLVLAIVGPAPIALKASVITIPPGLAPGSQYRLVFVTAGTTPATSTSIAYYNAFATAQADQNPQLASLDTTWTAIVSTPSVNAVDNIGTDNTTPLYGLNGDLVATSLDYVFSVGVLSSTISINQLGSSYTGPETCPGVTEPCLPVWTGSLGDGTENDPAFTLGGGNPWYGNSLETSSNWIEKGNPGGNSFDYPLYAISGDLVVPGPSTIPEPTTFGMITSVLIAFAGVSFRRRIVRGTVRLSRTPAARLV